MDPIWIYISAGIAAVVIVAIPFARSLIFKKGNTEIRFESKNDSDNNLKEKYKIKELESKLDGINGLKNEVETTSFNTGVEVTTIKLKDILINQMAMAEEHLTPLREVLTNKLSVMSKDEHDRNIYSMIVTIFMSLVASSLKISFERNNWRDLSLIDFDDMVERKIALLLSEWKRVVDINYPEKKLNLPMNTISDFLDSPKNIMISETFKNIIKEVFGDARRIKTIAENKIDRIKKDMKIRNEQEVEKLIPPKTIPIPVKK